MLGALQGLTSSPTCLPPFLTYLGQIIDGKSKFEDYKNGFVNLALPFFGFSEPIAAKKNKYGSAEWTLWDRFEFHDDPALKDVVTWFRTTHNYEVVMVSQGVSMLWSYFIGKKKVGFPLLSINNYSSRWAERGTSTNEVQ
jgi:hypothetical protein